MKLIAVVLLLSLFGIYTYADDFNTITKARDGLYFMYYDSSEAKSTIVEFENFIVLIEAPIKNEGGGARILIDHEAGGEKILKSLKNYFPGKPLKYFLHSHWHPHSISSINPFLRNNVNVITTSHNYGICKRFVDTLNIPDLSSKITFVEDSLTISDGKNKLIAYRIYRKDYPSVPTEDYLYFYIEPYNVMHCACMYFKWEGEPVDGKEMLTDREVDLNKFLVSKNLKPEFLIRYNKEKTELNDMQPLSGLEHVVNNGIKASDITKHLMSIEQKTLDENMTSVINEVITRKIPASVINTLVYSLLRKKELKKANSFALIQSVLNPSDPNAWDTLGETYFFLGETELAKHCERQSKKISPEYNSGGINIWQEDLDEYSKNWQ